VYGPVGSLGSPDSEEGHEIFDADGIRVFVHESAMAEIKTPGLLRFYFGSLGWADLSFEPRTP
jgi:hypothetical protein